LTFLTVEKTEDGEGYIGALMVTDDHGFPLEFRATTPVRPTAVQKVLYGATLETYVGVELCGRKLLQECQRKAPIVLVPNATLLNLHSSSALVLTIRRAGEAIKIETEPDGSPTTVEGRLASGSFQPVVYDARVSTDEMREALPLLERCFREFDLVETFERIRNALKVLAQEDSQYR